MIEATVVNAEAASADTPAATNEEAPVSQPHDTMPDVVEQVCAMCAGKGYVPYPTDTDAEMMDEICYTCALADWESLTPRVRAIVAVLRYSKPRHFTGLSGIEEWQLLSGRYILAHYRPEFGYSLSATGYDFGSVFVPPPSYQETRFAAYAARARWCDGDDEDGGMGITWEDPIIARAREIGRQVRERLLRGEIVSRPVDKPVGDWYTDWVSNRADGGWQR